MIKSSTQKIKKEFKEVVEKTSTFVKKNPEKTVLISAGIGAMVGAFLSDLFVKKEKTLKKSKK